MKHHSSFLRIPVKRFLVVAAAGMCLSASAQSGTQGDMNSVASPKGTDVFQPESFSDNTATRYTSRDMRFTTKGDDFYAIVLNGDADYVLVKSQDAATIGDAKIRRVRLLGSKEKLRWEQTSEGLKIYFPAQKPCEYAYSFKISFKGEVGKNLKSEASDEVMKHGV